MSDRLCVVMPVYNERDAIGSVLEKWDVALSKLGIDYEIRPYNDGSKDDSLEVMRKVAQRLSGRVIVRDKMNGGHGNTILTGYRDAAKDEFDWVFQIDSDDEMGPEKFNDLWSRRNDYDFLVGIRDGRIQALPRKIISFVSRLCVRVFYGKSVWDVNTPYRLMRISAFKSFYEIIPLTTFAPNVILSGLAGRHKLRCFETRVPQHDRTTGEVSIKKWKLLKAAVKSFGQTILFSLSSAKAKDWMRFLCWGAVWSFAVVSMVVGVKNGLREYDFQWDPAKLLMMGDNPYVYSLEHKAIPYEGFMSQYIEANQLPSCLLLLAPWTFLPQLQANYVWVVCNLFFTGIFLAFLYRSFSEDENIKGNFFLVSLMLIMSTPWRILVGNGQHLMFSLSMFMPAYYCAKKRKGLLAGVLLALSAFKYTSIVPLSVIFIKRQWWKPIFIAVSIHIIATIFCGLHVSETPINLVMQSLRVGAELTGQGAADFASLIYSFGGSGIKILANIGYCLFGALLLWLTQQKGNNDLLLLALLSTIGNVMFYHRIYDFVVLIFPLMYMLSIWDCEAFRSRLVKFGVIVNLLWFFFGVKIFGGTLGVYSIKLVSFALAHYLLAVLLACFMLPVKHTSQQVTSN